MELTQLRAFRTVAETQSFTRAAERLNLTQSAVSRQVQSLEAQFERVWQRPATAARSARSSTSSASRSSCAAVASSA